MGVARTVTIRSDLVTIVFYVEHNAVNIFYNCQIARRIASAATAQPHVSPV